MIMKSQSDAQSRSLDELCQKLGSEFIAVEKQTYEEGKTNAGMEENNHGKTTDNSCMVTKEEELYLVEPRKPLWDYGEDKKSDRLHFKLNCLFIELSININKYSENIYDN